MTKDQEEPPHRWTTKSSEDGTRILLDQKVPISPAEWDAAEKEHADAEEYWDRKGMEAELRDRIRATMPEDMHERPGCVLLSGIRTIRPGDFYVMGFNPGGDPGAIPSPITELIAMPTGRSAYTDQCWRAGCPEFNCDHFDAEGRIAERDLVIHQRRMMALLRDTLGVQPAEVPVTNAIFARSASAAELKAQTGHSRAEWWGACWPIHQHLLSEVRPRAIISLGFGATTSAFGLLHARAGRPAWQVVGEEGSTGGWAFDAALPLLDGDILHTRIIGIPHPSWYAPGPLLMTELRAIATDRAGHR